MHTHQQTWLRIAAGGCFLVACGGACAADDIAARIEPAQTLHPDRPSPGVPMAAISELGRAVAIDRLSGMRGGDGSHVDNLIDVEGSVDGNTAHHITSGSNSIADGAFNNASGINTVIQNTGSNVLIQNAMIVTVDFAGGPQ